MGTRPLVHVGFMKSWLVGGFNTKVTNRIKELVASRPPAADRLKIYITGLLPYIATSGTKENAQVSMLLVFFQGRCEDMGGVFRYTRS